MEKVPQVGLKLTCGRHELAVEEVTLVVTNVGFLRET